MAELRTPKRLKTNNPNQAKSRVQEAKAARTFRGKVVPGSGAGRIKGDVRSLNLFRLEAKTTKNRSFSVTRELIEKLEASVPVGSTEVPFLEITVDDAGTPKTVHIFPAWVSPELVEALEKARA